MVVHTIADKRFFFYKNSGKKLEIEVHILNGECYCDANFPQRRLVSAGCDVDVSVTIYFCEMKEKLKAQRNIYSRFI